MTQDKGRTRSLKCMYARLCMSMETMILHDQTDQLVKRLKLMLLFVLKIIQKHKRDSSKQRPMGLRAHLRNQFKSINSFEESYDYM